MATTLNNDFILFSTGQTIGASSSATMKNRIINGGMVIDQRNNGASVTPVNGQYLVDRWVAYLTQTSKFTAQQNAGPVTPPAGFTNYLGITSLSAYSVLSTDQFQIGQAIEGFNFSDLAWGTANAKTVTLSFWVYSSLTGAFGGSIRNDSTNRSYCFSYTISSANTWTQISVTIAGDTSGTWLTNNGRGFLIVWGLGSGSTLTTTAGSWQTGNFVQPTGSVSVVGTSGATFYLTGVQLEVGTVASSFDYRDYGRELILCQRYYEYGNFRIDGYGSSSVRLSTTYGYKVNKRINPTVTFTGTGFINGSGAGIDGASDVYGFIGYFSVTSTGGAAMATGWNSSAEL